jgi:hypothetical protein
MTRSQKPEARSQTVHAAIVVMIGFVAAGCATIEGGFRYEYDGKVFRADGKTPVKGAAVRMTRPEAPEAPDLPEKYAKSAVKYVDKAQRVKTDAQGRYAGALETVKGWKYNEVMGMHSSGPTKPPEPPVLDEVIVYVQERGGNWMGYRMNVPPEAQSEAISGVRKVHVPDLLLPGKSPATTQATTTPKGL